MAAVFPTTYYIGLGTAISNLGVPTELSGGSYARLACAFTGNALSGLTQTTTAWVVATAPTPAVPITYGLIYDGLTGGNLIAYFNWNNAPYTTSLTAMPIQTINITFNTAVSVALNLALLGGQGTSGSMIDAGAQIGTANGNPLLAGCRLNINTGGSLTAHLGQGQWVSSMDVQGSLFANAIGSGNINTGVVALAGASAAATPVLTGFYNRVTTTAVSLDSVVLPGPTLTNGSPGSLLLLTNSGAQTLRVFPDSGANINAAAASIVLTTGIACIFFRESSTHWVTIPSVAS